jgi:hypothetical protein
MTQSKAEYPIAKVEDVAGMLMWLVRRLRAPSLTAVVGAGGTSNSSLISFATGAKRTDDLNVVPVLRVLKAAGYTFEARPVKGALGVVLQAPGSDPMMVVGPDGGQLAFAFDDLPSTARVINSMAAANHMTPTGMQRRSSNSTGTSLVSLASGRSPDKDIRLKNLLRYVASAGFEIHVRPAHRSARAARMAFADANR